VDVVYQFSADEALHRQAAALWATYEQQKSA
jgi:hypothetical protein